MSYIENDFLLDNQIAVELYEKYARDCPIFDYHCHLSEYQIFQNKEFNNIYEIWLKGDHYKWRLMRSYGISENLITGNSSDKEKFVTYCKVLSTAFGNPLYHWSQLELKQYFNCDLQINEENADKIWDYCNDYIKSHHMNPQYIIESSNVKAIFTTNEITDDLEIFNEIKKKNFKFKVLPAFRADKILNIDSNDFLENIHQIGDISNFEELLKEVENKLQNFIKMGCLASDMALESIYEIPSCYDAKMVFEKRLSGKTVNEKEAHIYKGYFTYYLLGLYGKYGITSELHIGAMRNNNKKMLEKLGPDSGFDAMASDDDCIHFLSKLMDRLNNEGRLPRMIIFNLNPKMNAEITTLIGCFQDESQKGKIQHGAAWWFLDNYDGINAQIRNLASTGHIATYIGMLTDSRSFLSYSRHQYFRRILCNYFGELVENHQIENNLENISKVIKDICFDNSINYFNLKL